jgi:hypothetical protein
VVAHKLLGELIRFARDPHRSLSAKRRYMWPGWGRNGDRYAALVHVVDTLLHRPAAYPRVGATDDVRRSEPTWRHYVMVHVDAVRPVTVDCSASSAAEVRARATRAPRGHHAFSEAYDAELLSATVGRARKTTWKCRGPFSSDAQLKQARMQYLRLGDRVFIEATVNQL